MYCSVPLKLPGFLTKTNNSGFHEIRDRDVLSFHSRKIEIKEDGNNTIISISIETGDNIFGLGEKPGTIVNKADRRNMSLISDDHVLHVCFDFQRHIR